MNPIVTRLAGTSQDAMQANINTYGGPGIGGYDLVREPDNPHDPNAIQVAFLGTEVMGYVPASQAAVLAPLMDQGRQFRAEFVHLNQSPANDIVGITVRIEEQEAQIAGQAG